MEIYKDFTFEAAHRLPKVPPEHKCSRLHGHSFRARVTLKGPVNKGTGWVADFADIKTAFRPILEQLDHSYLNEVEGLQNPTSEVLAQWIWAKLYPSFPNYLACVEVQETCTSGARYVGTSLG